MNDSTNSKYTIKSKHKKVRKKEKKMHPENSSMLERPCTISDIWGIRIPNLVLERIFVYVVNMQGSLPFLVR